MKTYTPKGGEVTHAWHVLDATDQPLGRLATQAAALLRGKHKAIFTPNLPVGDFVVIVNAEKVRVTGNKAEDKIYYRHTMFPGGLRQTTFRHQLEKFPTRAVEKAVKGMLPHNRLGRKLFTRLKVYAGPEHPHGAQVAGPGISAGRTTQRSARVAAPAATVADDAAVVTAATAATVSAATASAAQSTASTATESTATAAPSATTTAAATPAPPAAATAPAPTIPATEAPESAPDTPATAPSTEE